MKITLTKECFGFGAIPFEARGRGFTTLSFGFGAVVVIAATLAAAAASLRDGLLRP